MNNIIDLRHTVDTINFKTLPSIYDVLYHINNHIGEYKFSSRSGDFNGWIDCDGRSLSRETYSDLFTIIGTSFGSNDGTTFKLPDLRGRVMGCAGHGATLTNRALGLYIGEETHALNQNEMPSHTHTGTVNASGGHTHTASSSNAGSHNHSGATANAGNHSHSINDPGHSHSQTTINDDFNNSGGNGPSFMADSAGVMTWNNINASGTGITINNNGDHTHNISSDGVHSHAITVDSIGDHTHTFTTNSTGSGNAHNNMQPTAFASFVKIFAGYQPIVVL